jgi:hypothetical protein
MPLWVSRAAILEKNIVRFGGQSRARPAVVWFPL